MKTSLDFRLDPLVKAGQQHLLKGGSKGLEKESLRITPDGRIASTPHPHGLGSALTHPYITTDYSEALIELITPPFTRAEDTLGFLEDLHRFVYREIGDECLLASSMPGEIDGDESIPIATYGRSNIGRMKHVYRVGLAWRYGRAMQAIAGIHFNYSVNTALWPVWQELLGDRSKPGDFIAERYFGLIRNVLRHGWLILLMFGNSPALCRSFFAGRGVPEDRFENLTPGTLYRPYATSLRMSDIGYRNDSQAGLDISVNSLDEYVRSLGAAIRTPYPAYERIGVKVDGTYRQLNTNILQIENEYYSSIRPKQVAYSGEKPTLALKRRGLRYIELRSVDLCCYEPAGISIEKMRFLEVFLLACLFLDSPPLHGEEREEASRNLLSVACCGRDPEFRLFRGGRMLTIPSAASELANVLSPIAAILDDGEPAPVYTDSLQPLFAAIDDVESTPSARVLAELRASGESFAEFALRWSKRHAERFREPPGRLAEFQREVETSLAEQARIEAADMLDFDEFLCRYFAQS